MRGYIDTELQFKLLNNRETRELQSKSRERTLVGRTSERVGEKEQDNLV